MLIDVDKFVLISKEIDLPYFLKFTLILLDSIFICSLPGSRNIRVFILSLLNYFESLNINNFFSVIQDYGFSRITLQLFPLLLLIVNIWIILILILKEFDSDIVTAMNIVIGSLLVIFTFGFLFDLKILINPFDLLTNSLFLVPIFLILLYGILLLEISIKNQNEIKLIKKNYVKSLHR